MKESKLIPRLVALENSNDSGPLSNLRRWWSPATRHYAFPVIARLAGGTALDRPEICLIAALFAEHPTHSATADNLGATCRRIAGQNPESFEAHFRRLLSSQDLASDLAPNLLKIIRRAKKEALPVNYEILEDDLRRWSHSAEKIKIGWAKSYYSVPSADLLDTPETPAS
ncbi:MAG: type I-E CRISPR-associated protein Cse2/CasB [Akkermansiaceae bacterium]|nr:type I-E CRISPR-associated protein Cse2/CasB [Akkermansiaceae bacterium]